MSRGNSAIVAPGGEVIAGPLIGSAGVVTATLDLSGSDRDAECSIRSATTHVLALDRSGRN